MQFGDANIRRFNLVTLDLRGHGETGGKAPKKYGQEAAAEDIAKFMVIHLAVQLDIYT